MPSKKKSEAAEQQPPLTVPQAAKYLHISEAYLYQLRFYGTGPRCGKVGGRIYYEVADLDEWDRQRRAKGEKRGRPSSKSSRQSNTAKKAKSGGAKAPKRRTSPVRKAA